MTNIVIKQNSDAVKALCANDLQMKKLVTIAGDIEVKTRPSFFPSLVRAIVGQQISVSAASTIYTRLEQLMENDISAQRIIHTHYEDLRSAGLSNRKVMYLQDLAKKVYHGEVDLNALADLPNAEAIDIMTGIKGIGKWTAEMFLIFSLGRMDVLAIDDIGIQRGAQWLYGVDAAQRRSILIEKEPLWRPHLSIASFYLWEAVHLDLVNKSASMDEMEKQGFV